MRPPFCLSRHQLQTHQAWIDHVVRARRTFSVGPGGKTGLLLDRPVFIAIASGGRFSGEQARQPDFITPYLKTILAMIGLKTVTVFTVQGTSAGGDPLERTRQATDRELTAHFSGPYEIRTKAKL